MHYIPGAATGYAALELGKIWNAPYLGKIIKTGRLRSIMVAPIRRLYAVSPYSVVRDACVLFCYRFVYNVS
jgi:hypothetical protein